MPITKGFRALVDEASAQVTTYRVQDLSPRLGNPDLLILDIRDIRELKDGTILDSYHAPRCMLEFWVDPESPYYKPLLGDESREWVLFCGGGWRSALAAKTLQDMGLRNVAHLEGGYAEWVRQGGPTETLEQRKARKV